MEEFGNIVLESNDFESLRTRMITPDYDSIARRDSSIRSFEENVSISREGTEVCIEIDDEYLKSLSNNPVVTVTDSLGAARLAKNDRWTDVSHSLSFMDTMDVVVENRYNSVYSSNVNSLAA